MNRASIGVALVLIAYVPGGAAQQPPALAFHDLAAMPKYPFAGMQANGAMGQTASMFLAEVPAGAKTTPHHHHQEQFMFGLEGAMTFVLAGSLPQTLARLTGSFAPANVRHGNINGGGPARYIEFQPLLRPDWYPPHPRRPREGTPEPLPIPADRKVTEDFSPASAGWRTERGARSKSLNGETAAITVWELPAASGPIDPTAGRAAERFIFVVEGDVAIADGASVRNVSRDMLIVLASSATNVRVSAPRRSGATLAVFEAFAR
jgi:quercetin dioxygenase-like cupin family protein